jgi:type II secretory pathway component PulC
LSGVVWTEDGRVAAIMQRAEDSKVETQVLRPGDTFAGDNTVVEEIRRESVILRDRQTGERIEVPLQSEAENPPPTATGIPKQVMMGGAGMMGGGYGSYGGGYGAY